MGYFQPIVFYSDPDTNRKNSVIRYIGNRVKEKNKNFLCAVTGATGAGKSWACIKMCEIYSEMFNIPFNAQDHVITSLKELLLLITNKGLDKKIKERSVILFDEPQVEGNATAWQSETNQALRQLISTFRNQRLVIFFALPFLEMLDKQSRNLFHGEFRIEGFNEKTGITTVKPRFLEYNNNIGDFYRKKLIINYKVPNKYSMNAMKLHLWHIEKASKENLDLYEAKKKKFTEDLNKRLLEKLLMQERTTEAKNKSDEFMKIKSLFEQYGEDYLRILGEMPHLNPSTLEKYIFLIKKSMNLIKSRSPVYKGKAQGSKSQ